MNQTLINSLPTFKFDSITGIRQSTATASLDCAICITKFENQDELRLLPNCSHVFHSGCIDRWILLSNYNCPICRSDVNGGDDDNELKMMFSNSSRSFRVEIGSVSLSRRIDDEIGVSASDLQNRSYSLGSFEYWIQDFDAEVFVELGRRNQNPAQSDDVSISVDDDCGGGMDEAGGGGATEVVIENRSEPDEVESCVRSLSHTLQFSNRFYGGNERRTGGDGGGGMEEGGCGGGGRVWDLEGNQFGGQIAEFIGFLEGIIGKSYLVFS
ncbi:hypothetical protein MKW94_026666 [Papaver nudicaule]|uniref:RING-type domain-containing protein n=1 Tax=Papaver nudicaule TaxID=74823 RepID=A0AA41VUI6_PAPNU|nr:hypothetical protein [Papaver nudicaule]